MFAQARYSTGNAKAKRIAVIEVFTLWRQQNYCRLVKSIKLNRNLSFNSIPLATTLQTKRR